MTKKRKPSPIGLSMLDLISNSLAAVIILFLILSTLKLPDLPPSRICGTAEFNFKVTGFEQGDFDLAHSGVETFLVVKPRLIDNGRPMPGYNKFEERYILPEEFREWPKHIDKLCDDCQYDEGHLCFLDSKSNINAPILSIYSDPNGLTHKLVINNPLPDYKYHIQLIYRSRTKPFMEKLPGLVVEFDGEWNPGHGESKIFDRQVFVSDYITDVRIHSITSPNTSGIEIPNLKR